MAQNFPPMPRYIYVHSSEQIAPHLQRIYFSSDDFRDFPLDQNGAHIKLFFPERPELKPQLPTRNEQGKVVWSEGKKPITRTYTIRQFLESQQLLIVDFVRHEEFGVAAHWAIQAQPGHVLGLAGPGGPKRFNIDANYWIFIGDLSALPMISASLEQLPKHAHGQIWIEIDDKTDQIDFIYPSAMQLHWIIKGHELETQIINSLKHLDWNAQQISVSLAGENARVVSLRHIFRNQFKLPKSHLYAVPYWKKGENEEDYHQERHRVMDE